MRRLILIIGFFVLLGVPFQNCTNVRLEKPAAPAVSLSVEASSHLCLNNSLKDYTLESFYVRNVNVIGWNGQFVADSDGDGLPDFVEDQAGFDATNPHSVSTVLDRVCFDSSGMNSCPTAISICSSTPSPLGLSDCDIQTLGLDQYSQPDKGLDTDKDGIIDYFEILGGTSPIVADQNADPDHDGILNQAEYARSSDPRFADAQMPAEAETVISAEQLTPDQDPSCVGGELWNLSIQHIPFIGTRATTNSFTGVLRGHDADQNTLVAVVKVRPRSGFTGNAQIYYQLFTIDAHTTQISFAASQLQLAGEVQP